MIGITGGRKTMANGRERMILVIEHMGCIQVYALINCYYCNYSLFPSGLL